MAEVDFFSGRSISEVVNRKQNGDIALNRLSVRRLKLAPNSKRERICNQWYINGYFLCTHDTKGNTVQYSYSPEAYHGLISDRWCNRQAMLLSMMLVSDGRRLRTIRPTYDIGSTAQLTTGTVRSGQDTHNIG